MARARGNDAWNHTADLMAHLGNLQALEVVWQRADFHPFLDAPGIETVGLASFATILPHSTLKAPS